MNIYKTEAELAVAIAKAVYACGGVCYYVGGYVRDLLLGIENKDIDMEIEREPIFEVISQGVGKYDREPIEATKN